MKKIVLLFVIGLVLIGCASVPLTPDGESLDGVWMREDGATITFDGNKWETVDMTNGSAGYGTFKFEKNLIRFTHTYIQNLKMPVSDYNLRWRNGEGFQEFQLKALKEFNRLYPEEVLQYDPENYPPSGYSMASYSTGGWGHEYVLEGNKLTIIQISFMPESRAQSQSWVLEPFIGVFIKQ
jgi:uncharacterized protein YceK